MPQLRSTLGWTTPHPPSSSQPPLMYRVWRKTLGGGDDYEALANVTGLSFVDTVFPEFVGKLVVSRHVSR